jgi:hypothetical protein
MVERRDHVFMIFLSPAVFIASIFLLRLASTKGPFLTDLGTATLHCSAMVNSKTYREDLKWPYKSNRASFQSPDRYI